MMAARSKLALETLGAGLALGIAGDVLMRAMPWGLNVPLATTLLLAAGVTLVRRHGLAVGSDAAWLALTAFLLAVAFVRRDAQILGSFDVFALLVTLGLTAASLQGERIAILKPVDYVRTIVLGAAGTLAGSFALVGKDVQWADVRAEGSGRMRVARAVGLGVLLAVPLLLVFGSLFAAADQVFGNVVRNLFAFDPAAVVSHTFAVAFWTALTAGYLRWSFLSRPVTPEGHTAVAAEPRPGVGIVPVGTALGLLTLLFLVFDVVQLRYFFGGADLVQQTTGLTHAEYAREGFQQLVTASALVLPVLLGADYLLRNETPGHIAVLRRISSVLLALLAVIMVSAFQRVRLYVATFGLSEIRLYSTAFMILLAGVFAWLAATVLRGRRNWFAIGALLESFVVLGGLHVLNPDRFIVRTNLARPTAVQAFDAKYALTLGADAVQPLLDALPQLDEATRCTVATGLLSRWGDSASGDWRSWNWSRSRARRLVSERAEALRAVPCGGPRSPR